MTDVIHQSIRLPTSPETAYSYFTENALLESFFTVKARVEPRVGGAYELDWDPEGPPVQSTTGCRITALTPGRMLAFDWKGPPPHDQIMNGADPLTHVVMMFHPTGSPHEPETEVNVVHSGWGSGDQWAAARAYFERGWQSVLNALDKTVRSELAPDHSNGSSTKEQSG